MGSDPGLVARDVGFYCYDVRVACLIVRDAAFAYVFFHAFRRHEVSSCLMCGGRKDF